MAYQDHFSTQADLYSNCRPHYPRKLVEWLASLPATTERAWDCGAGSGQASVMLAEQFTEVVSTDASRQQLLHAQSHPRVHYLVARAERAPLADDSVDLVSVAQALHWFDLDRFYAEVRRVGRRGAVLAAWGYEMAHVTPAVDRVIDSFYSDVLGDYWPAERRFVETCYATLPFPFHELAAPRMETTAQWNLDELFGYLGTWSSVEKYRAQHAADPRAVVHDQLADAWGPPDTLRRVRWPIFLRVGAIE